VLVAILADGESGLTVRRMVETREPPATALVTLTQEAKLDVTFAEKESDHLSAVTAKTALHSSIP
jgi:hypothetical protein